MIIYGKLECKNKWCILVQYITILFGFKSCLISVNMWIFKNIVSMFCLNDVWHILTTCIMHVFEYVKCFLEYIFLKFFKSLITLFLYRVIDKTATRRKDMCLICDYVVYSENNKVTSNCLVLVGSRNWFERDLHKQRMACFTIKLK